MAALSGQATWIAAALAAPAVAVALMLTTIESYRLTEPQAEVFGGPPPASLAASITGGFGVEQSYQFIRAGQDPNQPIPLRHEDYTDGKDMRIPPLMLAIAARDSSAVRMLLAFGARLELPQHRNVECLARELGNPEILDILAERRGEAQAEPICQGRGQAENPLLAWVEGSSGSTPEVQP